MLTVREFKKGRISCPGSHLCLNFVVKKLLVELGEGVVGAVVVQVQGVQDIPAGASGQPRLPPALLALRPTPPSTPERDTLSHFRGQLCPRLGPARHPVWSAYPTGRTHPLRPCPGAASNRFSLSMVQSLPQAHKNHKNKLFSHLYKGTA